MFDMFDMFGTLGSYDDRKVDRYEEGDDFFISTASVTDSARPFETAIVHPNYGDGACIVVECYDDREEAQAGHDRWVERMTTGTLPPTLEEVGESGITLLCKTMGATMVYEKGVPEAEEID